MLLSTYVSFRLSRYLENERISYLLLMIGFIIIASLCSTFVYVLWLWLIFLYPFSLVSFPFFSDPQLSLGDWGHLTSYNIHFFEIEIMSISPQNVPVCGFAFFSLINLAGAMIGYWINKGLAEETFEWKLFNFFFRSGIWSFLVCYAIFWLSWFGLAAIVWYRVNGIWFTIVSNTFAFSRYYFWVPATITTAIYGTYKWFEKRKEQT